jgi:hypothetical protein
MVVRMCRALHWVTNLDALYSALKIQLKLPEPPESFHFQTFSVSIQIKNELKAVIVLLVYRKY